MPKSFSQSAVNFLLKSNGYMALGASSAAYIAIFLMGLTVEYIVLAAVFFVFFLSYNFNRLTDFDEDAINAPERRAFVNQYTKPLIAISAVIYAYMLSILITLNFSAFLFILLQTALGSAYSIFRIKKYFLAKNIYIAAVWGMIVLFVGIYYGNGITPQVTLISAILASSFFINTIIFDIKDMAGDIKCSLKTIPVAIGQKNTILLGYAVNIVSVLLFSVGMASGFFPGKAVIIYLLFLYVFFYLYKYGKINKRVYYGLLVDGEFIFTSGIIFLYGLFYG